MEFIAQEFHLSNYQRTLWSALDWQTKRQKNLDFTSTKTKPSNISQAGRVTHTGKNSNTLALYLKETMILNDEEV